MSFEILDKHIQQELNTGGAAGVSLAITNRDKLMYSATYGYANVEAKTPVEKDTLFEIGSIGKSFTSIVVQQLVDDGTLDLHKPISDYVDWFTVQSEYEPITLHHLLSHTGGIINGTDFSGDSFAEVYALRDTFTASPPGTYFHYSNVGYKAVGVVLETLLQQPYHDIVTERILTPLGMTKTSATISNANRPHMATGYSAYYGDRPTSTDKRIAPATWLETDTADGCVLSTAEDLATYLRMLLNQGQEGILSSAGFERMVQPVIQPDEEDEHLHYGYGLAIRRDDDTYIIQHTGGMVGYIAYMVGDMKNGVGVTMLVNSNLWRSMMSVGKFALDLARSIENNQPQPEVPTIPDKSPVENAADYAGTYRSDAGEFTIGAADEEVMLVYEGERITLEQRCGNGFYVNHDDFRLYLLEFNRDEKEKVIEAFYGSDWYRNEQYTGATDFDYPSEWDSYVGHYRCYNPWGSHLRVIIQKGTLKIAYSYGITDTLVPLGDGTFRAGEDERTAERIRFDTVLNGLARCLHFDVQPYYRTFTP